MRSTIFGILFAVLGFVSQATAGGIQDPNCDAKCQVYKATRAHGLVRPQTDLVCIRTQQAGRGIIVIRFYDGAGRELDAGNKQHSNIKEAVDQFCVGRHYLLKAQSGHVEVCNDVKTKTLRPEEIAVLLRQGMPPDRAVRLFASR